MEAVVEQSNKNHGSSQRFDEFVLQIEPILTAQPVPYRTQAITELVKALLILFHTVSVMNL